MATGTIPMVSGIKPFSIFSGSPAILNFVANFRGVIFLTGTSSATINGVMTVAVNSTATSLGAFMLAGGSGITATNTSNKLTLSASTTVNGYVMSLNNAELPSIGT